METKGKPREHIRRSVIVPIKYFMFISDGKELKKIHTTGVTVDISEVGLGMITEYPLRAGDIVTFEDEEEIKSNDITAKIAIVRWSHNIEGNKYRVGMRFINI